MAYNWTLKEMYEKYMDGDLDCIADAGKRYPFAARLICMMGDNAGVRGLMSVMPDSFTANKLNSALKGNVSSEEESASPEEEKVITMPEPEKKRDGRGRPRKDVAKLAKEEKKPDAEASKYVGMKEIDLYKECVNRGLTPEKRKAAGYYMAMLEEDDKAKEVASVDSWGEDDDWGSDNASTQSEDDDWKI